MSNVIIVGAFHEIIELVQSCDFIIEGLIDNNKSGSYLNYPIIGTDDLAHSLCNKEIIITPDTPRIRKKLVKIYLKTGIAFPKIISSYAIISASATIGMGTIIQQGANVSSFSLIGQFVKINTNANIMHDCIIGDYCTIAPNAVILGNVNIGSEVYIGANSTILPNIQIGDNVIIGAGAVVTKSVKDNCVVMGVPAKTVREFSGTEE